MSIVIYIYIYAGLFRLSTSLTQLECSLFQETNSVHIEIHCKDTVWGRDWQWCHHSDLGQKVETAQAVSQSGMLCFALLRQQLWISSCQTCMFLVLHSTYIVITLFNSNKNQACQTCVLCIMLIMTTKIYLVLQSMLCVALQFVWGCCCFLSFNRAVSCKMISLVFKKPTKKTQ